jgi:hypothetical protein
MVIILLVPSLISDMAAYLKLRANLEAICEAYDNNPLA